MVEQSTRELIADKAIIHTELPIAPRQPAVDRTFELPASLYAVTVALYLGFLATMAVGFGNPALAIPLTIFTLFIIAGFGLPAIWARMQPDQPVKAKSWSRFSREGVMTAYGRSDASSATVQVLILPALTFMWGLAVLVVAAIVR